MTGLVQIRKKIEKRTERHWSRALLRAVPDHVERRPMTRGDCVDAPRPCPWVGCKYHLALEVGRTGSITIRRPLDRGDTWRGSPSYDEGVDWDAVEETCALDVADRGGSSLEAIGEVLGLTREAVRLIEVAGLAAAGCDAQVRAWRRDR